MTFQKTLLDTAKMTAIADAVRAKTGTTELMTAAQIAEAVKNIPQGGGGDLDALIDGSITTLTTNATFIRAGAFTGCTVLTSISGPKVQQIGSSALYNLPALSYAAFPNAIDIGSNAFQYCKSLTRVIVPSIKAASNSLFDGCTALETVNIPEAVTMGANVVRDCTSLKSYQQPKFRNTIIVNNSFYALPNIELIDVGHAYFYYGNEMTNCPKLKTVISRGNGTAAVRLSNISTFNGTPFADGGAGGTLYVPAALVEAYKTASNWSTLFGDNRAAGYVNNQILPIEGSEYEI